MFSFAETLRKIVLVVSTNIENRKALFVGGLPKEERPPTGESAALLGCAGKVDGTEVRLPASLWVAIV
jgi:hypothetical protein